MIDIQEPHGRRSVPPDGEPNSEAGTGGEQHLSTRWLTWKDHNFNARNYLISTIPLIGAVPTMDLPVRYLAPIGAVSSMSPTILGTSEENHLGIYFLGPQGTGDVITC